MDVNKSRIVPSPTTAARRIRRGARTARWLQVSTTALAFGSGQVLARPTIRSSFFSVYPNAVGTTIETVPSHLNHCGQCHFDFGGGGQRNPYGVRLGNVLGNYGNNDAGRQQAIRFIENEDSDSDGFSTRIEITNTSTFSNTPTFSGLTPANVAGVTNVNVTEIQGHLVPSTGGDTTPPSVTVMAPNGGNILVGNLPTTVQWSATDASGVGAIDVHLSDNGGSTFKPVALGLSNTGSYTWFPANRPTALAVLRVIATDNAFNTGFDDSNAVFTIESPPGGLVPTTLRDFDQPGSQPFEAGIVNPPESCAVCHGNYDSAVEPYFNWQGSMMAQASRDVLFQANMVIANQDAPDSGDMCLRCHLPRGWLQGRSVPTDGSRMLASDRSGVACDFCHRLVDPIYDPQQNPPEDLDILAAAAAELRLPFTVPNPGHAQFISRESNDPLDETKALSATRARQLMNMPTGDSLVDARDRAILKFYLYTAAQIGVGCRLKISEFHRHGEEATVRLSEIGDSLRIDRADRRISDLRKLEDGWAECRLLREGG